LLTLAADAGFTLLERWALPEGVKRLSDTEVRVAVSAS
jgi:hypothetical protein